MLRSLLWLAWAQLAARPGQAVGLIGSVAAGVMVLVVAMALTNGFEGAMIERLLGTTPHVALMHPLAGGLEDGPELARALQKEEGVLSASPFVQGQGLVASTSKATVGVLLRGIELTTEAQDPAFTRYLSLGRLENRLGGAPGLVLGSEAARRLGVDVGDRISLVAGVGTRRWFELSGTYTSGLYELDAHVAFVDLASAQAAFGMGRMVSGVGVRLAKPMDAAAKADAWSRKWMLGARPWTEQNRPLLSAMALERLVIALVLAAMVGVALVGMGTTLAMWVVEKRRELAMLRAMALPAKGVAWLLLIQGAMVGALGASLGLILATIACLMLERWPIPLPGEIYFLAHLPVAPNGWDFLLVGGITVLMAPLAAALPAWRAYRHDPVAALRRV